MAPVMISDSTKIHMSTQWCSMECHYVCPPCLRLTVQLDNTVCVCVCMCVCVCVCVRVCVIESLLSLLSAGAPPVVSAHRAPLQLCPTRSHSSQRSKVADPAHRGHLGPDALLCACFHV